MAASGTPLTWRRRDARRAAGNTGGRGLRGRFQGAVPLAGIHVDAPHLDPVGAGVAHELRRLVETHGLRVQDGGEEDVRVPALHPGRGVDQQREARRVALGKAVGGEALDLLEAALGEIARVAAPDHALHDLVRKFTIWPLCRKVAMARRRPSASCGSKPAAVMAICIGVLLEQGHAVGPLEHALEFVRRPVRGMGGGILDGLQPLPAAQVRMDHVALDRPPAGRSPPAPRGRRIPSVSGAAASTSAPGFRPGTRPPNRPVTASRRSRDRLPADRRASGSRARSRAAEKSTPGAGSSACRARARRPSSGRARRCRPCPLDEGAVRHGGVAHRARSRRGARA